ncbi:DNA mismatch repair protein, partial [Rhizopus azygosporus]
MSIKRYPIEPLDSSVVYKLRSSLVISTLTECVKELVQNAIDAEASSIHVSVDTVKFSIQVSDNGIGIENMSQLGRRYGEVEIELLSSKCHSLKDLSQLKTFGFRGEALASIMNESIVKIISRYRSSTDTFEAVWRESKLMGEISKHTKMTQSGTIVIVKDLFYKYPVRRRQASTPYQYVVMMESVKRLLTMYALCFPCIQFTLID